MFIVIFIMISINVFVVVSNIRNMINYRPKINNTHFFETSQISLKSNLNFI